LRRGRAHQGKNEREDDAKTNASHEDKPPDIRADAGAYLMIRPWHLESSKTALF
jgi:hypothetical protein